MEASGIESKSVDRLGIHLVGVMMGSMEGSLVSVPGASPALIPSFVGIWLIGAVIAARMHYVVWRQTTACLGLLVASWFVADDLLLGFGGWLLFLSCLLDRYADPKLVQHRKGNLLLMILTVPLFGFLAYRGLPLPPTVIEMTDSALVESRGENQRVLPRSALRIVEFSNTPHRVWHVKDGTHVVGLYEGEDFAATNGERWTAREMIGNLEKWAGIRREHTMRDP